MAEKRHKLTANQSRILWQLIKGHPPTGFSNKGIDSLVSRGLATTTLGHYKVNRRHTVGLSPIEIYVITDEGKEALHEDAERKYKAEVRTAKRTLDESLRRINSAKTG